MDNVVVIDSAGVRGRMQYSETAQEASGRVVVTLPDGQQVVVPCRELTQQGAHLFSLSSRFADLLREQRSRELDGDLAVIPLIEEVLDVERHRVERGVRIRKTTEQHTEVIDASAVHSDVEVERVAINRIVDRPIPIRREGDTIIIPVMEEKAVCEKRLVLREELRVTVRRSEQHQPKEVTLRRETVVVEPVDNNSNSKT